MEEIMKIIKSLEDSVLSLKGVSEKIQNEAKVKKEDFLVRYQVHQVQVYQVIFQQVKE